MINLTTPNSSSFISIFCIELKHWIAIAAHGFTSHCHRCSSPYFASRYNIELPLHLIVSHRIAIVVHPYILHRGTTSNCHRNSLFSFLRHKDIILVHHFGIWYCFYSIMPVKANIGGCGAWQEWVCIKCNVARFDDEERAANHFTAGKLWYTNRIHWSPNWFTNLS